MGQAAFFLPKHRDGQKPSEYQDKAYESTAYLESSTVLRVYLKVKTIYKSNTRLSSDLFASSVSFATSDVVLMTIRFDVWLMAVPEVHHLGPIFRG